MRARRFTVFVAALAVVLVPAWPALPEEIGVTPDTITIGLHVPLTNAGIRGESWNAGKDLYWEHGDNGAPVMIAGRQVEVLFANDEYNPSVATRECKKLSGEAFLLAGVFGADQMQACARHADLNGIPYISPGSTESGFRSYETSFAATMTYAQQVPIVAQYIRNVLGITDASRVAGVITDTGMYDDASVAFAEAFPGARIFRPSRTERGSSMAPNLCTGPQRRYEVVFPLASPAYFLEMAGSASCQPQYVGVGLTVGLDEVANIACSSGGGGGGGGGLDDLLRQVPIVGPLLFGDEPPTALDYIPRFLSPAPAFQNSDTYDPAFRAAAAAEGVEPDDQMWILWGLSKTLHKMLDAAGPYLDRASFISSVEGLSASTGVFPDVSYTPENHFGARQAHMLKMKCEDRGDLAGYFVTERAFVESF